MGVDGGRDVLLDLHRRSGSPSYADLARRSEIDGDPVSDQAFANLLGGRGRPRARTVAAFVSACVHFLSGRADPDLTAGQRSAEHWLRRYREGVPATTGGDERPLVAVAPAVAYVDRDDVGGSVADAVADPAVRLVVVTGDSGNGKSRLVYEVLNRLHADRVGTVHLFSAESEPTLVESVIGRLGDRVAGDAPADVLPRLLAHLAARRARGPVVVGLDDVVAYPLVKRFLEVADTVVVTAAHDLVPPDVPHTCVRVGPLSVAAGTALVRRFVPDIGDEDARRVLWHTGGKPRVVIDCLSVFATLGMTVDALCDQLSTSPRALLSSVGRGERSVVHAYESFAAELAEHDPRAHELLAVLALTAFRPASEEMLRHVLARLADEAGNPLRAGEFERCLYVVTTRLNLDRWHGGLVRVNTLTGRIFADLFEPRREVVSRAVVHAYAALPVEKVPAAYEITRLPWIWRLADALYHFAAPLSRDPEVDFRATVLAACTGLTALGERFGCEMLLRHLAGLEARGDLVLPPAVVLWAESFKCLVGATTRAEYLRHLVANQDEVERVMGVAEASETFYALSYQHSQRAEIAWIRASAIAESAGEHFRTDTLRRFGEACAVVADSRAWTGDLRDADDIWTRMLDLITANADQDHGERWSSALDVAATAVEHHSQAFDHVKAEKWWAVLADSHLRSLRSHGPRPHFTSRFLSGRAWFSRVSATVKGGNVVESFEAFLGSAAWFHDDRDVRAGLADLVEAAVLGLWITLQDDVDPKVLTAVDRVPDRAELRSRASRLGELHLYHHLVLAERVAETVVHGPDERTAAFARRTAFRAADDFEQARLYRLACGLGHVNGPGPLTTAFTAAMADLGQLWTPDDLDNLAHHGRYPSGLLLM
ncbi:ATP-binding protein [Actinosynnema sp. NPDC020468]|uniref:ATP-binding protein n=1 Tax=Actinosynnema sp. NPDC020468 TaxID=3154488 RepID=UPI0033E47632